jgi:hypothetical protein
MVDLVVYAMTGDHHVSLSSAAKKLAQEQLHL